MPDTGKILAYRTAGGFGTRLDAGNGLQGQPYRHIMILCSSKSLLRL